MTFEKFHTVLVEMGVVYFPLHPLKEGAEASALKKKDEFWRNTKESALQVQYGSYTLTAFLYNTVHLVPGSLPNPKPLSSSLCFPKLFPHSSLISIFLSLW